MKTNIRTFMSLVASVLCAAYAAAQGNVLTISDVTAKAGSTVLVPVCLDNTEDIAGVEFNLTLPDGLGVSGDISLSPTRAPGHIGEFRKVSGSTYKAILYSMDNTPLSGRTGEIFSIPVSVPTSLADGSEHPLTISDVVVATPEGDNVASGHKSGTLTIARSADLAVTGVKISTATTTPGEDVSVSWTVTNIGGVPTMAGFSERLYLVDTNGVEKYIGVTECDALLSEGENVTRAATLRLPSTPGVDGPCRVKVTLSPRSGNGEPSWLRDNNTCVSSDATDVGRRLYLSSETDAISESEASTAAVTLQRSGNATLDETFTVKMSVDDARFAIPATVTIPAGSQGTRFEIKVTPNGKVDETDSITVTVGNDRYCEESVSFTVEDDVFPTLSLDAEKDEAKEGEIVRFTLSSNKTYPEDLTVTVLSDYPGRLAFPTKVTIPAGENETAFDVTAIDNELPEGDAEAEVRVSAAGFRTEPFLLTLLDDDVPQIALTLSTAGVAENEGKHAVTGVITRKDNLDRKITIRLTDDSDRQLQYSSSTLVMKAGEKEAEFTFGPVDNSLADGDRTYEVTAGVYLAGCSCTPPQSARAGVAAAFILVTDDDGPALSIQGPSSVAEGGEASFTVSRNTDTETPLEIHVTADTNGDVETPESIVIPSGASQTTFKLKGITNSTRGDDRKVSLTAEAEGHGKGFISFIVTDRSLPDAKITKIEGFDGAVLSAASGDEVTLTVTLSNQGTADLPELTPVSVYLDGVEERLVSLWSQRPLPSGESEEFTAKVTMPDYVGNTFIRIIANELKEIAELDHTNNIRSIPVNVSSPYSVCVTTDKKVYAQGEKITVSGKVTGNFSSGGIIKTYVKGASITLDQEAEIRADGTFTAVFEPFDGLTGSFRAGACHPTADAKVNHEGEVKLDILGIRNADTGNYITHDTHPDDTVTGTLHISNPCGTPVSGLNVSFTPIEGMDFKTGEHPSQIAADETVEIPYELTFNRLSPGHDWEILGLNIGADGTKGLYMPLYLYSRPKRAMLETDLSSLYTSVSNGSTRTYPVAIVNNGGGEAKDISFSIPSWMSVSPSSIPNLAPGASANVSLTLKPGWKPGESNHSGKIFINCASSDPIGIPFDVEVTAASEGTLEVEVCDNLTYIAPEAPRVAGASITLSNAATGKELFIGTSDNDGLWSLNVPEGRYILRVSADGHDPNRWSITVDPGKVFRKTANITVSSGVKASYDINETEVEDKYNMTVTTTYETNVPRPDLYITALDQMQDDELDAGDSRIIRFLVKNVGMIRADGVWMQLPESGDDWAFEKVFDTPATSLEAGESIIESVLITKISDGDAETRRKRAPRTVFERCMENFIESYYFYCGDNLVDNPAAYRFALKACTAGQIYSAVAGGVTGGTGAMGDLAGTGEPGTTVGPGPNQDQLSGDGPNRPANNPDSWGAEYRDITGFEQLDWERTFCNPDYTARGEAIVGWTVGAAAPVVGAVDTGTNAGMNYSQWQADEQHGNADSKYRKEFFKDLGGIAVGAAAGVGRVAASAREGIRAVDRAIRASADYIPAFCDAVYRAALMALDRRNAPRKEGDDTPSWVVAFEEETITLVDEMYAYRELLMEYFGDETWIRPLDEDLTPLFTAMADRSLFGENGGIPYDVLMPLKPDRVSESQMKAFLKRLDNTVTKKDPTNMIDMERFSELLRVVREYEEASVRMGFKDSYARYNAAADAYRGILEVESNSVCASVTLQFRQSLAMTRQAFRGTLTVSNGHETEPLRDFRFIPTATAQDGHSADETEFAITAETLSGFDGETMLGAPWELGALSEGTSTILYIPTQNAAPEEDTPWAFGGTMSYIDPYSGTAASVDFSPVYLTVRPTPILDLDYFLQRDVFGDDPLTEAIEPSSPAEFALMLTNAGKGMAKGIRLVTPQPEITANEKGADIDFRIESSTFNGKDQTVALGADVRTEIGDVPAGESAVAQWWFTSSMLGHFIDYDVEFSHVTNYDNPNLSLIRDAKVHELIRSVITPDGKIAFLADDMADAADFPETIYFQGGSKESTVPAHASIEKVSETEYLLHVSSAGDGWTYGKVKDPSYGVQSILSVRRQSDGKEMPLRNFWQTDRTLVDGLDPLYENMIHFADCAPSGTESYRITLEERPDKTLEVSEITGIPENGVSENDVNTVTVRFSKPVDVSTFTQKDLELRLDRTLVPMEGCDIIRISDTEFTLDLSDVVSKAGDYTLTVNTSDIVDTDGFTGRYGKAVSWTELGGNLFTVSAEASPAEAGTVSPGKKNGKFGEKVTFTAVPAEGYRFLRWEEGNAVVGRGESLDIQITHNRSLTAVFLPKDMNVSVECEPGGSVTIESAIMPFGSLFEVTAMPDEDYGFAGWTVNGENTEGDEPALSVLVDRDLTVTARFIKTGTMQSILLEPGWNWISTYADGASASGIAGDVRGMEPEVDCTLSSERMYKVKSPYLQLFEAKGRIADGTGGIHLKSGANWIGYPSDKPVSLDDAFRAGPTEGDFICGQRGFSEFCDGAWTGTLGSLLPGEGYIYHVGGKPHDLTLSGEDGDDSGASECHPTSYVYEESMCITFVIKSDDSAQEDFSVELLCEDESRGFDSVVDGVHMATVFGKQGDSVVLRILDRTTGKETVSSMPIDFEEGFLGSRNNPIEVYLSLMTVNDVIESGCTVSVFTPDGLLLLKDVSPEKILTLTQGIYIVNGKCLYIK